MVKSYYLANTEVWRKASHNPKKIQGQKVIQTQDTTRQERHTKRTLSGNRHHSVGILVSRPPVVFNFSSEQFDILK
jgi:hypothetical protein